MITDMNIKGNNSRDISATLLDPNPHNDRPASERHIVVIVHGYTNGSKGHTEAEISAGLYNLGVSSIMMNLNLPGDKPKSFELQTISNSIEDVAATINKAKSMSYGKISLFGFDLGGNIAANAVINADKYNLNHIHKLCLKSPVSDVCEIKENELSEKLMQRWKNDGYLMFTNAKMERFKVNYEFFEDAKQHTLYANAGRINVPTLIVHSMRDEIVPIQQSDRLVQALPKHTGVLVSIDYANHEHTTAHNGRAVSNEVILNFLTSNGYNK